MQVLGHPRKRLVAQPRRHRAGANHALPRLGAPRSGLEERLTPSHAAPTECRYARPGGREVDDVAVLRLGRRQRSSFGLVVIFWVEGVDDLVVGMNALLEERNGDRKIRSVDPRPSGMWDTGPLRLPRYKACADLRRYPKACGCAALHRQRS